VHPGLVYPQLLNSVSARFAYTLNFLQTTAAGVKTIIFSQFLRALELIGKFLDNNGVKSCYFHGSLSSSEREKILGTFKQANDTTVLLMSLKAGSLGLNLTVASQVVFLDSWWNDAVEGLF
jgi:DNA repair protein RAD5